MYEGKNIHYSPVDQKPLCSFSGKICNQRRLNKYGFCVRHILEDPNAPFKRCAYVAKSSRQTCTQPIPKNEEREYCNNHMQVLGMLPKKARKPKKERLVPGISDSFSSHGGTMSVPILLQSRTKPKLTVSGFKTKFGTGKISAMADSMDDVYAFPTEVADKTNRSSVSTMVTNVAIPDISSSSSKTVTYSTFTTKSTGQEGAGSHSSLAKIYPELAEKLEKIKPKLADPKVRGKVKNSRTMNSLQTKIAQNKIKDKLKRNQSSSNASSQSQSPSHGFTNVNSPGCHVSPASSPSIPVTISTPSVVQSISNTKSTSVPSTIGVNHIGEQTSCVNVSANNLSSHQPFQGLSQFNLLNSLNLQTLNSSLAQLGFPVPTASDIEQTLQQLAKAANISLEGAPIQAESISQSHTSQPLMPVIPGLPGGGFPRPPDLFAGLKPTFTSLSGPPPPYSSIHHKPSVPVSHSVSTPSYSTSGMCVTDSVKPLEPQLIGASTKVLQRPSLSEENISKLVPSEAALPNSFSSPVTTLPEKASSTTQSSSLSSTVVSSSTAHNESLPRPFMTSALSNQGTKSYISTEQNGSNSLSQKQRPPKLKSRLRNSSALSKRPVPVFTLPMTVLKPQKIRKVLSDDELEKLKTKSAINYYKKYKMRKECNHDLIITGLDSSDDDSDLSDCDMLPWQPDWFIASSDEEGCDEDESDYDLRTTKLALVRAQLRRQCFQARLAYKTNMSVCQNNNETTSSLIQAAKDSARFAVRTLNEINGKIPKPKDRYKTRGLDKRQCLYKDNDEVQCKGIVVPYTNHCIKHVMYNVDQQLFEYCTAKFSDNTQCCHPVIDLKHELPLCMEHGLKADNFLKTQEAEPKPKRPRKKTKPSALTRPPKKGKKKKNQRKAAQLLKAQSQTSEDIAVSQESDEDQVANDSGTEPVDMEEGDDDSDKEDSEMTTDVPSKSAILKQASVIQQKSGDQVVIKDSKPVISSEQKSEKVGGTNQLEELDNLTGLPELDNVKMFGDLPLETASKLLEENDFQEVLNRLPDEAFDIFNKTSALPSNEELEELEKSLAMANRDLRYTKDSVEQLTRSSTVQSAPTAKVSTSHPSLIDDTDEITRQIAEEILKQNIESNSGGLESSVSHRDAQESIKAIARSLSTSGMFLTSDINQRSQSQDSSVIQGHSSLSRSQSFNPYSCVSQVFSPPNVALHTSPQSSLPVPSVAHGVTGKLPGAITASIQPSIVPRNVTVMPQGMFQTRMPVQAMLPVSTQLPISAHTIIPQTPIHSSGGSASVNSKVTHHTTSTSGVTSLQASPQLTAQQISQLVQQAALQLPPVPPYIPRSATSATQGNISLPTGLSTMAQAGVNLQTVHTPIAQLSQLPVQTSVAQLYHQQLQTASTTVQTSKAQLSKQQLQTVLPSVQSTLGQLSQQQFQLPLSIAQTSHQLPVQTSVAQLSQKQLLTAVPTVQTSVAQLSQLPVQTSIAQLSNQLPLQTSRAVFSHKLLQTASTSQTSVAQLSQQPTQTTIAHLSQKQLPTTLPTLQTSIAQFSQLPIQTSVGQLSQQTLQVPISIAQLSQQQLQVQQQQLVRQRDQLTQHQQHLLTQQLLQQHLLALATQHGQQSQLSSHKNQGELLSTLQQQISANNQTKVQPVFTPSVNISALLQQGQKLNNLSIPTVTNVLPVQIPQLIKSNIASSQSTTVGAANLTPVTLPTASIVWTAPPNVTITSSNGFTRNILHGTTSSDSTVRSSSNMLKQEDTVIDLTDSNDSPSVSVCEKSTSNHPTTGFLSKPSAFGKS